ncbi:MAG: DUF3570 domain-containing protein [Pseudomonadales bacterium]
MNKKNDALTALTSVALLIPGFNSSARADPQPEATSLGYRYSFYSEKDLPDNNVEQLSTTERYEIDVHQFQLVAPVADRYSVKADLQYETMSGASPWQTQKDSQGIPRLIMSGASIKDTRTDVAVQLSRHGDNGKWTVGYQRSDEDDYEANALSVAVEWDINNRHTTISTGASYSDDELEPTQGTFLNAQPITREDKQTASVFVGVSQILGKNSLAQASLSFTRHDGYLTDPYKFNDRRPDERDQWTLSTGYRRFFNDLDAALHADYRFYDDDWGVNSHTLSAAWYQNLGPQWQLVPSVRYYSQDSAQFFGNEARDHEAAPFFSDDFRLSTYGAVSFGLKLNYQISSWTITFGGEQYTSNGHLGVSNVSEEAPALLEFTRFTLGLDYRMD